MKQTVRIEPLSAFKPLYMPNHTQDVADMLDSAQHRAEVMKRLLSGDGSGLNLNDLGIKKYLLYSGRSSGKTYADEEATALDLVQGGRGDVWYTRAELGDIRNSIFTSMQQTLHRMGMTVSDGPGALWRAKLSPFELICNKNGNRIQFFAINKDINRSKGFTPPSGVLKRVIVEEANEMDDSKYITALETTAVRYLRAQSKIVLRSNPAETRQHWSVSYFDELIRGGATRIYTTWEDLARCNKLSIATVAEILKMKRDNPLFYRYWYLGEIVKLSGLVFPQFDREKHIKHFVATSERRRVVDITSRVIIAGDAANKNDATCFGALLELKMGNVGALLLADALYYDPKINGQKDDVEMARIVCDWYENVCNKYPGIDLKRTIGTVDNANWNLIQMLQRSRAMGHFKWYPASNKSIMRDVNRLRVGFRENMIIFNDAPDNQVCEIIREIENYVYDDKTGQIKANQSDHGIDMLKYGTYVVYADTTQFF